MMRREITRLNIFQSIMACGFVIVAIRMIAFQFFPPDAEKLMRISNHQYRKMLNLSSTRGDITDRNGDKLAVSIQSSSIFVNPQVFSPTSEQSTEIAKVLEIPKNRIDTISKKKSHFAWLKRKVQNRQAEAIRSLDIDGLTITNEPSRVYPSGTLAAAILGNVNIDSHGLSGLELQFDHELQGNSRQIIATKDARGRVIFSEGDVSEPTRTGYSISLTIDHAIQKIAFDALKLGVREASAQSGSAVVVDPNTGAILAVANYPSFDPNEPGRIPEEMKNHALQDIFEPGSVIKPFVIGGAIDAGLVQLESSFDCNNGVGFAGGVRFGDAHAPKTRYLTTLETIVHSSNVCTFEIAKLAGKDNVEATLRKAGIGERSTKIGFPGQAFGAMSESRDWLPIRFANIAFGQGLTTSLLEISQFYSVFANGGLLLKPFMVRSVQSPDGHTIYANERQPIRRVFSSTTVRKVNRALAAVVSEAAPKAQLSGYSSAGKTGTSQKIDEVKKAYSRTKHRAVFAGFAPLEAARLVVVVMIDEPGKTPHYGALWAAPVFKQIAEQSLRYLNVPQDQPGLTVAREPSGRALE